MALPRIHRLVLSQQKTTLLGKTGKKIHTSFLTSYFLPGGGRFAVIVGTNISKKAVIRNKIRRLFHQAILASLPKEMEIYMMIYPKTAIVGKDGQEIKQEVTSLFEKIHS